MTRNKNNGWQACLVEGCPETKLRLSGMCIKHDLEALQALLDAPPYENPFPTSIESWLEEKLKDPKFKKAYETEYARLTK